MRFHQTMLSTIPEHYRNNSGLAAMPHAIVEVPIELTVTISNRAGETFTPSGETVFDYLANRYQDAWGYFNAAWPEVHPPSFLESERDSQWLRRRHYQKIMAEGWTLPLRGKPERPYADPTNAAYRRWLVDELVQTGAYAIIFDNGTTDNRSDIVNRHWFTVYDAVRSYGVRVYVNGVWQSDEAIGHTDGYMCEYVTDYEPRHINDNGDWAKLTEAEFIAISRRWADAGKAPVMLVRWRPGLTEYSNYDDFCRRYLDLAQQAKAIPSFALHDYQRSGWCEWMEPYQREPEPPEPLPEPCCDVELLTLREDVRRLDNYVGALMDEVETMKRQMLVLQELQDGLAGWALRG
jgi:hypothetical protein